MCGVARRVLDEQEFTYAKEVMTGFVKVGTAILAQWINNNMEKDDEQTKSRDGLMFKKFLHLVQEKCPSERKVSWYASQFFLSPKYFAKIIFDVSGKHVGEWVKDYVILEAKTMLRSGNYTVQQVSQMLNFPNASFFGKYFKSGVGCSPGEYMMEGEGRAKKMPTPEGQVPR